MNLARYGFVPRLSSSPQTKPGSSPPATRYPIQTMNLTPCYSLGPMSVFLQVPPVNLTPNGTPSNKYTPLQF